MQKVFWHIKSRGFSLLEVTIAVAILATTITGLFTGIIEAQQNTMLIGVKNQALLYAEEGLEAVRNMRDYEWDNLANGTHGLVIANQRWDLSGNQDTNDNLTRHIDIETDSSDRKRITSVVEWTFAGKTGSITLATYMTNWKPF